MKLPARSFSGRRTLTVNVMTGDLTGPPDACELVRAYLANQPAQVEFSALTNGLIELLQAAGWQPVPVAGYLHWNRPVEFRQNTDS